MNTYPTQGSIRDAAAGLLDRAHAQLLACHRWAGYDAETVALIEAVRQIGQALRCGDPCQLGAAEYHIDQARERIELVEKAPVRAQAVRS